MLEEADKRPLTFARVKNASFVTSFTTETQTITSMILYGTILC